MKSFFFDTADISYIEKAWTKISSHFSPNDIAGITTNPSSLYSKANVKNHNEMQNTIKNLCKLVTSIRGDGGVVYVQHPNSTISTNDLLKFVQDVIHYSDGTTKVGIKIPPYLPFLQFVEKLNTLTEVNVTGIADCSTALLCFTYPVRYVSIIPGRMEEQGIDSVSQLKYVGQRNKSNAQVITGSMRTIKGLQSSVECGTVPTIGIKVFDQIFTENKEKEFSEMWNYKNDNDNDYIKFSPHISGINTSLSVGFFNQMDEFGKNFNLPKVVGER